MKHTILWGSLIALLGMQHASGALPRLDIQQNGLTYDVLQKAGDTLSDGNTFALKNDRTAYFPTSQDGGVLLVGHEIGIRQDALGARVTRLTLNKGKVTHSQLWVSGFHNFCSGTATPWNTLWAGEEFPNSALEGSWQERQDAYLKTRVRPGDKAAQYGWIYEIDPFAKTPEQRSKRLSALGRLSHEGIVIHNDREVYMTEDFRNGHLYKFVADQPFGWNSGKLYALGKNQNWLPLSDIYNPRIQADALGARIFNRLEDARKGPDGLIYLSETGDPEMGDRFGRIWSFDPTTNRLKVVVQGNGKDLANPDNMVFSPQGELYIAEDKYGEIMQEFGPNKVVKLTPRKTLQTVLKVNFEGEPSGLFFDTKGQNLFMSIMAKEHSAVVKIHGF